MQNIQYKVNPTAKMVFDTVIILFVIYGSLYLTVLKTYSFSFYYLGRFVIWVVL
jgi:hypothetical protein